MKITRKADRLYIRTLEAMLVELHLFVERELDPDPASWEAYYTDRRHQALAKSLHDPRRYPLEDEQ